MVAEAEAWTHLHVASVDLVELRQLEVADSEAWKIPMALRHLEVPWAEEWRSRQLVVAELEAWKTLMALRYLEFPEAEKWTGLMALMQPGDADVEEWMNLPVVSGELLLQTILLGASVELRHVADELVRLQLASGASCEAFQAPALPSAAIALKLVAAQHPWSVVS